MKKMALLSLAAVAFFWACQDESSRMKDYPITPVPFTRVKVTDQFWSGRIETNHKVTIPIAIQKSRETGRIKNFAIAGGLEEGKFCTIFPFDDSDIYKIIEGAAYSLQMFPDPQLEATCDSLIHLIGLAQEDDGYLYTNRTIMGDSAHKWAGTKRWEKVDDLSHELYNLGHFYEAATAYFQATGKQEIMDIAIKSADLVDRDFGKGKIENWPGHQEVEIGLVKLYRQTGDKRYLDLARFFLDVRGKGIGKPKTYNQSHIPVVEQSEAVGHSVRAAYMWSGMADVAALTGDSGYVKAIGRIWEDVAHRKMYITGGIGAEGGHEGFGGAYELPNEKAYCETCAGIANVFWNHRMFLMTGDARYIDVLERSLYNNVLSGVSLSGDHFFYPNPLESHGQHHRSEWFGCACCPSNITRLIPSMPSYIYAGKERDLYVNLYVQSQASLEAGGKKVTISQEGGMPWDGRVKITISTASKVKARLHLRIPSWATDEPFAGELYRFKERISAPTRIKVNGADTDYAIEKGYAILDGKWKEGDVIELEFPYAPRRIEAHHAIADDAGKVAIQRGPIVYCTEFADYDNQQLPDLSLPDDAKLDVEFRPDLLGGVSVITAEALEKGKTDNLTEEGSGKVKITAIPYYGWSHRGSGAMKVWIPSETAVTPVTEEQK